MIELAGKKIKARINPTLFLYIMDLLSEQPSEILSAIAAISQRSLWKRFAW